LRARVAFADALDEDEDEDEDDVEDEEDEDEDEDEDDVEDEDDEDETEDEDETSVAPTAATADNVADATAAAAASIGSSSSSSLSRRADAGKGSSSMNATKRRHRCFARAPPRCKRPWDDRSERRRDAALVRARTRTGGPNHRERGSGQRSSQHPYRAIADAARRFRRKLRAAATTRCRRTRRDGVVGGTFRFTLVAAADKSLPTAPTTTRKATSNSTCRTL